MKRKRLSLTLLLFLLAHVILSSGSLPGRDSGDDAYFLYEEMQLSTMIPFRAFKQALSGYERINTRKKEILTLVDFSKPSTRERLFVLDLKHKKILHVSHVAHGRNSGDNYAISFSNKKGSFKSSLGFFLTEGTYMGKNGYSLVLNGLEKGINDKAKERAIVIHGAAYADPKFIQSAGRLGRSQGCPALPLSVNKKIIDLIKGGSVFYIYADNEEYIAQSPVLNDLNVI